MNSCSCFGSNDGKIFIVSSIEPADLQKLCEAGPMAYFVTEVVIPSGRIHLIIGTGHESLEEMTGWLKTRGLVTADVAIVAGLN